MLRVYIYISYELRAVAHVVLHGLSMSLSLSCSLYASNDGKEKEAKMYAFVCVCVCFWRILVIFPIHSFFVQMMMMYDAWCSISRLKLAWNERNAAYKPNTINDQKTICRLLYNRNVIDGRSSVEKVMRRIFCRLKTATKFILKPSAPYLSWFSAFDIWAKQFIFVWYCYHRNFFFNI